MVEKETGAFTKVYNKALKDIKSMINNSEQCPTAYSVDNVVEELERFPLGNLGCQELNEIIEIVKQGGVGKVVE